MDQIIRTALKEQYKAGLKMLRHCVDACPDDLWTAGTHPRNFWRIAHHAVFYAHLYLVQNEAAFERFLPEKEGARQLWADDNPPVVEPYTRAEVLGYIDHVSGLVDTIVDRLDLETSDSGFSWYTSVGKLEHEILSIRHLGVHVGQLQELLDARGVDFNWVTRA